MTPEEWEQYVLVASDASNIANQQKANALLNQWISITDDISKADLLGQVLKVSQHEMVLFNVLTTYERLRQTTVEQRGQFRQDIFYRIMTAAANPLGNPCWSKAYLRTKVGVLLASFIQLDFVSGHWSTAFEDLINPKLLQDAPDIFLRTLVALMDDFGHNETTINANIKDVLRGYAIKANTSKESEQRPTPTVPPSQTMSARILQAILSLLAPSLEVAAPDANDDAIQAAVLSLTALRGTLAWIDLSLVLEDQQKTVLQLIFRALAQGSTTDSPMGDAGVVAVQALGEIMARGMEEEKKVAILIHTSILETIYAHVDLKTVDASPIDVVMEVARFINRTGLEVLTVMMAPSGNPPLATTTNNGSTGTNGVQQRETLRSQLLELFFRCFAYDDIDVSGAVVPLAGSLVPSKLPHGAAPFTLADPLLLRLLSVTYQQMRYPAEFEYDYENEDEAEEEQYRDELRKLHQKFIRVAPEACLEFMGQTLSHLTLPLSSAPTPDLEAAVRLVFHYCEGIRPPPGMKVVMRNETFCNMLVALHTSNITMHPHREVLTRYYETAVRYYPLLKERTDLLQTVLEAISGPRGLQHENGRVRSRCCYMLLRLVKSVGSNSNKEVNVLRPYVETAVVGIQTLLENSTVQLRTDDTLNLFETIGLLLGKTGLDSTEQQQYLTNVMTPHVRSIERVLEQKQAVLQDPETYGEILANSIAAIANLSKGFKKPSEPVQRVLFETVQIATTVLELLPAVEIIRNKTMVLIQRLIQCLEDKVLPAMPRLFYILIPHSTVEDILDVAQLLNQVCIKFHSAAIPILDPALLPFFNHCQNLANGTNGNFITENNFEGSNSSLIAPHQKTEQLSIQKFIYMVLHHIVANQASGVLLTATNLSSLEHILQSLSEGAFHVEDPTIKKTCLVIINELFKQWVNPPPDSENGSPASASEHTPTPAVLQGFLQFVCQVWIPGILQSFARPAFDINDANNWRCMLELALLLDLLRQRLPEIYQQEFVDKILSHQFTCPPAIISHFRDSKDRKSVESSVKILLEQGNAS